MSITKLIIDTNLSVEAQKTLNSLGYLTVDEILNLNEEILINNNLKKETITEILDFIKKHQNNNSNIVGSYYDWIKENSKDVEEYIKINDIQLKTLPINVRIYNALLFNNITMMSDIALEDLSTISNMELMNKNYAIEIDSYRKEYLNSHKESIIKYVEEKNNNQKNNNNDSIDLFLQNINEELGNLIFSDEKNNSNIKEENFIFKDELGILNFDEELDNLNLEDISNNEFTDEITNELTTEEDLDNLIFENLDNLILKEQEENISFEEQPSINFDEELDNPNLEDISNNEFTDEITNELTTEEDLDNLIFENLDNIILKEQEENISFKEQPNNLNFNEYINKLKLKETSINEFIDETFNELTIEEEQKKEEYKEELNNLDLKKKEEQDNLIFEKKDEINEEKITNENIEISPIENIKIMLLDGFSKEKIINYFKKIGDTIENIELSVRASNALNYKNINYIYELIELYPSGFNNIANMGKKSIDELHEKIELYILDKWTDISNYLNNTDSYDNEGFTINPLNMSILQLYRLPKYQEKVLYFLEQNDISIESMNLSTRAFNVLKSANMKNLSDIIKIYPDKIPYLPQIGKKSITEITEKINCYLSAKQKDAALYCSGDLNALYSDEFILEKIWSCYEKNNFSGISYNQIREKLPEDFDDLRLKKVIGKLLTQNKLEYVDFRCYRVYPSVFDILDNNLLDEKATYLLKNKMNGMTLEALGQELGVTRERIRQICKKSFTKLREQLFIHYGVEVFDEDYYVYFYSNYEVPKELWIDYLNIPSSTLGYLSHTYDKGLKNIEEALSDTQIDLNIKFRIRDYLNKDKIMIDGILFDKNRTLIEEYAISKLCREAITYDDFCEKYNELLQMNNIPYDEKIYSNPDTKRTRINKFMESMKCLYTTGERIRYYDIVNQDYTELLDTLNLINFKNTEVSTLKFFNNYPELMKKYDIQNQYELHNLLKKTVDVSQYNDLVFTRQPILRFGNFDRDKAFIDILFAHAPVTTGELLDYIYEEYGYDKFTTSTGLDCLKEYCHNGLYTVDFKKIPNERVPFLKQILVDNFYYIEEIREKYLELYKDADIEEINPHSLRNIGYTVFTNYIIQNYNNTEEYLKNILTSNDVYDIEPLNKKYSLVRAYYNICINLRKDCEIFYFDNTQVITIKRLNKLGIQKEDIKNYSKDVNKFVGNKPFFTLHSLKKVGFSSKLDDLGFDDSFYSGILGMSDYFTYQRVFGTIVLHPNKINGETHFAIRDFILNELSKYESIDIDTFIENIYEDYGINITDRYKIIGIISDSNFYYDSIMDKIYQNKNYYYEEFDN